MLSRFVATKAFKVLNMLFRSNTFPLIGALLLSLLFLSEIASNLRTYIYKYTYSAWFTHVYIANVYGMCACKFWQFENIDIKQDDFICARYSICSIALRFDAIFFHSLRLFVAAAAGFSFILSFFCIYSSWQLYWILERHFYYSYSIRCVALCFS